MKLEFSKQYKTADGREVRLSFEDQGVFYGHFKSLPLENGEIQDISTAWHSAAWDSYSGYPAFVRDLFTTEPSEWEQDIKLVEQIPSKLVSVELYILKGGSPYTIESLPVNVDTQDIYASCIINFEIEKGVDKKVVHIEKILK